MALTVGHVDRTNGNDGNDGSTFTKATKTVAAIIPLLAAGAIVNLCNTNPGANEDLNALNIPDNVTIQQEPGQPAYEFDGAYLQAGFADDGGGGWSVSVGAAVISGVTVDYAVGVNGAATGFLTKATSLANCHATNDSWFSGSGTLTIRIGANVSPVGHVVEVCTGGVDGLAFPGANGLSIFDFTGRRWVDMNPAGAATGVPVIINGSTSKDAKNCTITIIRIDDGGRHCCGIAGLNLKNNSISGGTLSGTGYIGTLAVFQANDNNAANNRCSNVTMYGHTYLSRTGTAVIASSAMVGGYSHCDTGHLLTNAGSVSWTSCPFTSVLAEDNVAFSTADTATTASPDDWRTYPVIINRCPITSGKQSFGAGTSTNCALAFVNCDFSLSGSGQTVFETAATTTMQTGFFGSAIRAKGSQTSGAGSVESIFAVRAGQLWTFHICSICHTSPVTTHYLEIFEVFAATGTIVAHGSIFGFERAHSGTNDRYLVAIDSGTVTQTFTRNAYYNVDHFSQDGVNDTFANWNANIEGGLGINSSASPFLDTTKSLQLNPSHPFYTTRIALSAYAPTATTGINGFPYSGSYGAYQVAIRGLRRRVGSSRRGLGPR